MAAETRAPGVPFLAMSASVLMASGACLRASSWMLLAALGGYEVGGRQISVWPCIRWAFDLSGIVAFAGTQYDSLTQDRMCRLIASSVTVSHRRRRLRQGVLPPATQGREPCVVAPVNVDVMHLCACRFQTPQHPRKQGSTSPISQVAKAGRRS